MTTLKEQLAAARAERDAARDPDLTTILNRATADLAASTILQGIPGVGDRAPLFARPNIDGETIRLADKLEKGPVLLSFFRGRW